MPRSTQISAASRGSRRRSRTARPTRTTSGSCWARSGASGNDLGVLHGVSDAARDPLKALVRVEAEERGRLRRISAEPIILSIPIEQFRTELVALADAINGLDRTVNRRD